jgi:hypothetical protein
VDDSRVTGLQVTTLLELENIPLTRLNKYVYTEPHSPLAPVPSCPLLYATLTDIVWSDEEVPA